MDMAFYRHPALPEGEDICNSIFKNFRNIGAVQAIGKKSVYGWLKNESYVNAATMKLH